MTPISIGITTRDRRTSLLTCLRSIAATLGHDHEVMVFDDASEVPAASQIAGVSGLPPVRVIRDERRSGYIAGRNEMVRQARHEVVLLMDDDAVLLDAGAVQLAAGVLRDDPAVAAIAFAQAERDGRPWPEAMQAGSGRLPAAVPSFIGFAHLLRRSVFLALGGYQERLVFYGEEKEYCLRLLAAGHRVVYLPEALVAHVPDPGGRDPRRYVRYAIRNDCLCSLYNDPWPLAAAGLLVRLRRYRRMASRIPGGDPGGLTWLLRELWTSLPSVRTERRPLTWAQVQEWRRLKQCPPYRGDGEARHA